MTGFDARTTRACNIAAWILAGAGLALTLALHLIPALISALLVYELVHILAPWLRIGRMRRRQARLAAVVVLVVVIVLLMTLAVIGLIAFVRGEIGGVSSLLKQIADILESLKSQLPAGLVERLPTDVEHLKDQAMVWVREHAADVQHLGTVAGRAAAHILIGIVVGAVLSIHEMHATDAYGPLASALMARASRLAAAFRRVVFGQLRISAINTFLTALYLIVALPIAGIHLPLAKTLIAITFVVGLLPVVGNLISNALIVLLSLSISPWVGVTSLIFLIVIHKLEYFLNAYIIGTQVRAHAWELLIAMAVLEAAFGVPGLVAAPIFYAYLKDELVSEKLV